jgi:hypothetical protein
MANLAGVLKELEKNVLAWTRLSKQSGAWLGGII